MTETKSLKAQSSLSNKLYEASSQLPSPSSSEGVIVNQRCLSQPLVLSNGTALKNRIVKSAMSDSLGDGAGNPTEAQTRLYERWAEGGMALSIIGEVQIDARFPEKPGNLVLGEHSDIDALRQLTSRASVNGAHIWPQIGHAGALSYVPVCCKPKGPSELDIGDLNTAGMSLAEVRQLPEAYAKAADIAKLAGFTGIQIHAGHGFLLSQFLSPLFNHRSDEYGGSVEGRSRIIVEIITKVRQAVGLAFPIGIKVNTSDLLEGGLTQNDALEVIGILDGTSVDLIELSGGTYFPGAKSSSDSVNSGPHFVDFAAKARQVTNTPLIATGGFKTRHEAIESLTSGAVDMVGVARATILNPSLANEWLSGIGDPVFPRFESVVPGGITAWYSMLLTALGNDSEQYYALDLPSAIREYEARDAARTIKWKAAFSI